MAGVRASLPLTVLCLTVLSTTIWFIADFPVFSLSNIPSHGQQSPRVPSQELTIGLNTNDNSDESKDDSISDVQNRTLGVSHMNMAGRTQAETIKFQKIYAISMLHRTDKRDYLVLMGHVSRIDITFIDGVEEATCILMPYLL